MEHQKILNSLNEANDWNIVSDHLNANYSVRKEIIYSTEVLNSSLCDYNDAYILVRGDIIIIGCNLPTEKAFKNFASFIKCSLSNSNFFEPAKNC